MPHTSSTDPWMDFHGFRLPPAALDTSRPAPSHERAPREFNLSADPIEHAALPASAAPILSEHQTYIRTRLEQTAMRSDTATPPLSEEGARILEQVEHVPMEPNAVREVLSQREADLRELLVPAPMTPLTHIIFGLMNEQMVARQWSDTSDTPAPYEPMAPQGTAENAAAAPAVSDAGHCGSPSPAAATGLHPEMNSVGNLGGQMQGFL